jgi:hypothetical protein
LHMIPYFLAHDHPGREPPQFSDNEHDPMLYEDAKEMVEYVGQALKQTSREAIIVLYVPAPNPQG